jgi:hypothetical protein
LATVDLRAGALLAGFLATVGLRAGALLAGFLATVDLRAGALLADFLATLGLREGDLATGFLAVFFFVPPLAFFCFFAGEAALLRTAAAFPADDFFAVVPAVFFV